MDTVPTPTCPTCGAAIPTDAPQGLCPRRADRRRPARGEPPSLEAVRAAFPQLEILGLLGAGGMGFVFQARQPHLDRLVALKLLPIPLAADPHFSERFLREGRLLARLAHPGIVSVHDFGQAGGFAYLLMEHVDGVNLRQAMAAGRFTPAEALAVVPKICEALQYAHGRGVLHRDIKPENLLLDAQGRVKIADFGIAKLVGDPARGGTLTGSGARLGTPHYMAPEQVESPGDVDHRADIYSLGVVFYEMLTGELPLGRFAPPSQKTPLDARVDEIVLRALAKERELRQQSAAEVKTEVEGLAASEGRVTTSPAPERLAGARLSEEGRAAQPVPTIPALSARASRLAGWAVVGMALPQAVLAVVFLALVLRDADWNPGQEELLVALALWIGAPITLLSGVGLLRHGRPARTEISRGTAAAVEGLGFVAGLLCLGVVHASSLHPAGFLALLTPSLAALALLVSAGWQRRPADFAHRPAAARPTPASEYRSSRTLWGLPLLHIVRGADPATGREREARGIVAIGGRATGVLAIGGLARGVVAFGGAAFGLFAFGGLAFGGVTAGGLAVGLFSFGGLAVGLVLALGGIAAGWSAFGGLVVAQQGLGGYVAAGERLPYAGPAATLIRWLPWLWIPIVPLSLVPGLVSVWAHRKLDAPAPLAAGPRPNPWPHRLFWLVIGLIILPLLAVVAGLVGARAPWVAMLLMLVGGAALVLGWRMTRPTAATPINAWNPWPRRIIFALLAVVVLPLLLLGFGLLMPRLAMQSAGTEPPFPVAARASLSLAGLPETLTAEQARHPAAFLWHQAWRRWQQVTGRITAGELAWDDPEVLAARRDLDLREAEARGDTRLAAQARLAHAEALRTRTRQRFEAGLAAAAEVSAAELGVTDARATMPPGDLGDASFEVREYLRRMLPDPVAGLAWNLDFWTDERASPTPRHYLRFRAPRDEVSALLVRGGFVEGGEPAPNPGAPAWWRAGPGIEWRRHTRAAKPAGCALEELWTHRLTDEVFYRRECQ